MVAMRSSIVLAIILILTSSSLMMVESARAQTQPSVPEFTVKLEAHPYEEPPTFKVDPYTGENLTTRQGYRVENRSIVVTIKNQPFDNWFNSTQYDLGYYVRVKGHFEENWVNFLETRQSGSDYTVLSKSVDYPAGAQVDFQVQAYLGSDRQVYVLEYVGFYPTGNGHYETKFGVDKTSDWSNPQTVSIPSATLSPTQPSSPTQQPTTEPTQTAKPTSEIDSLPLTLSLFALVISIANLAGFLVVYFKKIKKEK